MCLIHFETIPPTSVWKNCPPWDQSLVPKWLRATVIKAQKMVMYTPKIRGLRQSQPS